MILNTRSPRRTLLTLACSLLTPRHTTVKAFFFSGVGPAPHDDRGGENWRVGAYKDMPH